MKNEFPLEKMDLALFDCHSGVDTREQQEFSQLNDFLNFLKLYKRSRPYRFSHVEVSGPLIDNLTLEENLLLYTAPNNSETAAKRIDKLLDQTGNPYLLSFYNKVSLKSSRPSQVDDETRKSMALIKGMIQQQEFLFLENPEKYLGKEMLSLFTQALIYQSATTGQIVVISTRFKKLWTQHFTKQIYRDEKNFFRVKHFNNDLNNTLLSINNAEKSQSEGVLKIVNMQNGRIEENKKAS